MSLRRLVVIALLLVSARLEAQEAVASQLIERAKAAYNALNHPLADSLTRSILAMPELSTRQRVLALQIRAAALYPDPQDGAVRDRAGAVQALQEFVKLTFDQRIAREFTWPGLDTLLTQARAATFAARAFPDREYVLEGADGSAKIVVRSTRKALFRLAYLSPAGETIALDSIGPDTAGSLTIHALADTAPLLPAGPGEMQVTATDVLSEESVMQRFPVRVKSPSMGLVSEPPALSAASFKPERKKPSRVKGIVFGILVGGATIALSTAARGPEGLKDAFDPDSRATAVGIGLAVGVIAAGFLDPGQRIPENIKANEEIRARWSLDVQAVRMQNERLRASYRQTITFESEAP
ncbi:MAG TPA: hypothetical protein VG692_11920 [Gemmatimonadales bacterium]|nr:hypothetical protein [Gemmatimonadales bacterium]